jgi:hypothetical protein
VLMPQRPAWRRADRWSVKMRGTIQPRGSRPRAEGQSAPSTRWEQERGGVEQQEVRRVSEEPQPPQQQQQSPEQPRQSKGHHAPLWRSLSWRVGSMCCARADAARPQRGGDSDTGRSRWGKRGWSTWRCRRCWCGRRSRGSICHSVLAHLESISQHQRSFRPALAGPAPVQRVQGWQAPQRLGLEWRAVEHGRAGEGRAQGSRRDAGKGAAAGWARYRDGCGCGCSGGGGEREGVESRSDGRRARCGRRHEQRRVFELARTAASGPGAPVVAAGATGEELLRCNRTGCACSGAAEEAAVREVARVGPAAVAEATAASRDGQPEASRIC